MKTHRHVIPFLAVAASLALAAASAHAQLAGSGTPGDRAVYELGTNLGSIDDVPSLPSGTHTWDFDSTSTVLDDVSNSFDLGVGADDTKIFLTGGHHIVIFGGRWDSVNERSNPVNYLKLNGTQIPYGQASGYTRDTSAKEAFVRGGTILNVSQGDYIEVESERTDIYEVDKPRNITQVDGDLQLIKLDDANLDFLRLSRSTTTAVMPASNEGPTAIAYEVQDELAASSFGHSTSITPEQITLKSTGHYLIFANTGVSIAPTAHRNAITQTLKLDGTPVDGGTSQLYLRNANANDGVGGRGSIGAVSVGVIVEVTNPNSVLTVEVTRDNNNSTSVVSVDPTRTGLAIAKLPSYGEYITLAGAAQNVNTGTATPRNFSASADVSNASFTYASATSPSQVVVNKTDDVLFLSSYYAAATAVTRGVVRIGMSTTSGGAVSYGASSSYCRNQALTAVDAAEAIGNWAGAVLSGLSIGDGVETTTQQFAAANAINAVPAIQALNIATISTPPPIPIIQVNNQLDATVNETKTIDGTFLTTIDADNTAALLDYTIDTTVTGGVLKLNGVTIGDATTSGGTFTQKDIDDLLVTFEAGNVENTLSGFDFTVRDNPITGLASDTFSIRVIQELLLGADATSGTDQDSTLSHLDLTVGSDLFDNDTGNTLSLFSSPTVSTNGAAVTVNSDGTFLYDPNNSLAAQVLGTGDSITNDTFTYTLTDLIGKFDTTTVTIPSISGVEDIVGGATDDDGGSTLEGATLVNTTLDVLANDGLISENQGNNLILNYEATGDDGGSRWENTGDLGGTTMDFALTGVTHGAVTSSHAKITSAFTWDTTDVGAFDAGGGLDSISEILGASVDTNDATWEFWVKPDASFATNNMTIFETGGGTGWGCVIDNGVFKAGTEEDGRTMTESYVNYDLIADPLNVIPGAPGAAAVTADFVQIAVAIDIGGGGLALYVNGILVDETTSGTGTDWDGGDPNGLGRFQGDNHSGFQGGAAGTYYDAQYLGQMAIVRCYSGLLSSDEVLFSYRYVNQAGLVDVEGDAITVHGLYDNGPGSTLTAGLDIPVTLASGAIVELDSTTGNFTYDPNGAFDGLLDGASAVDTFTYALSDAAGSNGGQLATAEVTVTINGVNAAIDDGTFADTTDVNNLQVTELTTATFTANQVVGNDDHSIGALSPYIRYNANEIIPGSKRLNYDGGLQAFSPGQTVTGGTSGATGTVAEVNGTTAGSFILTDVSGVFANNEQLTGDIDGTALANGAEFTVWENKGTGGNTFDVNVDGGTLKTGTDVVSNFGAIGSAYENITGTFPSFTAIDNAPVTIEVWFKPDFAGTGEQILVETGGSGTGTSLSYDNSTGFVTFRIDGGAEADANTQLVLSATGITPNEFNHLVAVYYRDEFGVIDTLTLYVNNDPTTYSGTPNASSYPGVQPTGVNDITGGDGSGLGRVNNSLAQNRQSEPQITDFQGQIAIMRIYGRALTAAEIEENFDVVVQPITGVAPDLVTATAAVTGTSTLGATVTLNTDGSFDYDASSLNTDIPEGDKVNDSFVYAIDDGEGGTTKATVTVTVTGVGNYLAQNDDLSISAAGPAGNIDVTANDNGFSGTTSVQIEQKVGGLLGDIADTSGFSHGDAADFRTGIYGWQLLWNAPVGWTATTTDGWDATTGPLGTAASYQQLVWDTTVAGFLVDANGLDGPDLNAEPGAYLRLTQAGLAHPGLGSAQDGGLTPGNNQERCLILAYTVSEDGLYAITNSTITTGGSGNGVTIETYVEDSFQNTVVVSQGTTEGDFDQKLGTPLVDGDTIYVAVCPNTSRSSDTVPNIDFEIVKIPAADYELLDILGAITVNGTEITYDPSGQFDKLKDGESVFETFTYTLVDPSEGTSTATVTVEVIGVNDLPIAVDDNGGTTDDNSVLNGATVLTNDTDVDLGEGALNLIADMVRGDGAAVAVPGMITTAKGANVTMAADGTFTYDPTTSSELNDLSLGDADTTDTFFYSVRDVNGAVSGEALVTLTITPADDGVFANPNTYTVDADLVVSGNVITDDTGDGPDVSIDAGDILSMSAKDEDGLAADGVLTLETPAVVGARGTATVQDATVVNVSFGTTFATTPVVIAGPPTYNEAEPTVARVTNVTPSGFDLHLVEQLDGAGAAYSTTDGVLHLAENVSWVAIEEGIYQLANGATMEVGSVDTQVRAPSYLTVPLSASFSAAPVVLNFLQTANQHPGELFGTRSHTITTSNFQVALENYAGAVNTARTLDETIGYIAIDDNQTGAWSGSLFETDKTPQTVDHDFKTFGFDWNYGAAPTYVAAQTSIAGVDPAQLRMQNLGATSVQLTSAEDTVEDDESPVGSYKESHADEQVSYLVIGGSGNLEAFAPGTVQGAFTYDPAGAFTGLTTTTQRTFDYTVTDSLGNVDTTTVTIIIDGGSLMRSWRNAFFGAGGTNTSGPDNTGDGADLNDFDSGTRSNILEFAFGGDPTLAADDGSSLGLIDGTTWSLGNPIMTVDFSPLQIKILYPRVMESDGVTPFADLGYTPQYAFDNGVAGLTFEPDPNRNAATRVQKDGGGDLPVLEAPGLASGVAMKYALYQEIVPIFHPTTGLKLEQLLGRVEVVRGVNAATSGQVGP